jgi:hypothetical protein
MTSKLLHAIVGVGIAFGAGAGCGGSSSSESDAATDGGPDTSKFDPFCDATWPTTKGYPGPPACTDPRNECDPHTRLTCASSLGGARCDDERYSAFCIEGAWVCHPDQVVFTDCRCFGEIPPGKVCTESGWATPAGGAG